MIRFINPEDTLPIRSEVLRNGKPEAECVFEGDNDAGAFHLGFYSQDVLVGVASFHLKSHSDFTGQGYQLRGMATLPSYQKSGVGNQLLNFAVVYLRGQGANYLWCNARQAAYRFYQSLGFEFISAEFDIQGIGLHRQMYLKIR